MKVSELIEELIVFDPDMDVIVVDEENAYYDSIAVVLNRCLITRELRCSIQPNKEM